MNDYIYLGFPFDQLMNQKCAFPGADKTGSEVLGGITIPSQMADGTSSTYTGNIVIRGRPGTGKSTLALQFAIACAESGYLAAYYSLELDPERVMQKAEELGWKGKVREIRHMHYLPDKPSAEELGENLMRILTQPDDCPAARGKHCKCKEHNKISESRVLLPSVSPRNLRTEDDAQDTLFWERFRQLENLLRGAKWVEETDTNVPYMNEWSNADKIWLKKTAADYWPIGQKISNDPWMHMQKARSKALTKRSEKENSKPRLRMVCIDSLNVFGDKPLTREQLFRVFDLFSRSGVIGVFVVEEAVAGSADFATSAEDDTIDYLADTVISLKLTEDQGYAVRHFSIEKSRYQEPVIGVHPFKIGAISDSKESWPDERQNAGVFRVYPSLHYVVKVLERNPRNTSSEDFDLGCKAFTNAILPSELKRQNVVTIKGPRGTFKTTIAFNFLVTGLLRKEKEPGLLIRLHDRITGSNLPRVSKEVNEALENLNIDLSTELKPMDTDQVDILPYACLNRKKIMSAVRELKKAPLIEIAFKSGYLLPEEFVDAVRLVLNTQKQSGHQIKRVVLNDVATIGLSYPYLRNNSTTGDIFLSAFVHLMRIYGVDLVITGTTGELAQANEIVHKASALADAVVTCNTCDIFGERHITVSGERLLDHPSATSDKQMEFVPGVIKLAESNEPKKNKYFEIDLEHLRGLVGFDSSNIRRPGLSIHCFESSGVVHERYNADIRRLLESAFASAGNGQSMGRPPEVNVVAFNARTSAAVLDSLGVLKDAPLDRTMLHTLDEFWGDEDKGNSLLIKLKDKLNPKRLDCYKDIRESLVPYYGNVLLVAYRCDVDDSTLSKAEGMLSSHSWKGVAEAATILNKKLTNLKLFEMDRSSRETRSCALLDAVASAADTKTIALHLFEAEQNLNWGSPNSLSEVSALVGLVKSISPDKLGPGSADDPNVFRAERVLSEKACVYLCWYTQLRDLIYRHPELVDKIKICALPAGGFSGDWFLGVARGSLSYNLGQDIVTILCSEIEDNKRYYRGVGLPTLQRSETNHFSIWPNSLQTLEDAMKIHQDAGLRSSITGYKQVRRTLYTTFDELAHGTADVGKILESLQYRIKSFQ